jgi:hypothetical protein
MQIRGLATAQIIRGDCSQMRVECLGKLDPLFLPDAVFVQSKQVVDATEGSDRGDVVPVEMKLDDRRLFLRRPTMLANACFVEPPESRPSGVSCRNARHPPFRGSRASRPQPVGDSPMTASIGKPGSASSAQAQGDFTLQKNTKSKKR